MNIRFISFGRSKICSRDMAEFIFKNYYKTAYHTAYKHCDSHFMAEDAAQETIFKAINNIDQLKDPGKLESWVKAIARNTVFEMIKKSIKIMPIEKIIDITDIENSPSANIEDIELVKEVQNTLKNLSEPYHSIVHLYYYKSLKVKEISRILEAPEGTIKSLLHRGRNIIKRELIKKGLVDYWQDDEVNTGEK